MGYSKTIRAVLRADEKVPGVTRNDPLRYRLRDEIETKMQEKSAAPTLIVVGRQDVDVGWRHS